MLDLNKPIQARNGNKVTILTTEARGPSPIIGYIGQSTSLAMWRADGRWYEDGSESRYDLVNVPQKRTIVRYVNMYKDADECSTMHKSRSRADACAGPSRVGCKRVEIVLTEGEYDD